MSTPEMLAVQMQLQSSAEQLQITSTTLDNLRIETGRAFAEIERQLAEEQKKNKGSKDDKIHLVNSKSFEGGKYNGAKMLEFKGWSKKVKIFCNSQHRGFRAALEKAEECAKQVEIGDLGVANWELAKDMDEKLYDFLVTFTAEEALRAIEPYQGSGFEAWRQLKVRYSPSGGRADIDRAVRMMTRKPVKSLAELPAALDLMERDLKHYETAAGHAYPEEFKPLLLIQLLPESEARELKMKFKFGQSDYRKMRDDILAFANDERHSEMYRGAKDMDVDTLVPGEGAWTLTDWEEWYQRSDPATEDLNYMGKGKGKGGKGKGKGKGKDGKGKDGNKGGNGKGKGPEKRECYHCGKIGHLKAECRS